MSASLQNTNDDDFFFTCFRHFHIFWAKLSFFSQMSTMATASGNPVYDFTVYSLYLNEIFLTLRHYKLQKTAYSMFSLSKQNTGHNKPGQWLRVWMHLQIQHTRRRHNPWTVRWHCLSPSWKPSGDQTMLTAPWPRIKHQRSML